MDDFGNLQNWYYAIEKLEELSKKRQLDDQQHGLARILRYRENPRLTFAALTASKEIRKATDTLIADVLAILVSREAIIPHRVLAAEALGVLVARRVPTARAAALDLERVVLEMSNIAKSPGPPVVVKAVEAALDVIRNGKKKGGK